MENEVGVALKEESANYRKTPWTVLGTKKFSPELMPHCYYCPEPYRLQKLPLE